MVIVFVTRVVPESGSGNLLNIRYLSIRLGKRGRVFYFKSVELWRISFGSQMKKVTNKFSYRYYFLYFVSTFLSRLPNSRFNDWILVTGAVSDFHLQNQTYWFRITTSPPNGTSGGPGIPSGSPNTTGSSNNGPSSGWCKFPKR